jgi:hypothetical protein
MNYATSRKVAGSIPNEITHFCFNCYFKYYLYVCLIVVRLPPGRNPFAVKINNNKKIKSFQLVMALGSTHCQPPTEMSNRFLPDGKRRPARDADDVTVICELID